MSLVPQLGGGGAWIWTQALCFQSQYLTFRRLSLWVTGQQGLGLKVHHCDRKTGPRSVKDTAQRLLLWVQLCPLSIPRPFQGHYSSGGG